MSDSVVPGLGAGGQVLHGRLRAGYAALAAGRPEEAARASREVLAIDQNSVPAHFLVGLVSLAVDDRATALSAFGSVTRLEPRHAAAWAQLARLFVRAGQPNRADQALAEAVANAPEEPMVLDLIGTVFSQLGDQASARDWYSRAVALAPDNAAFRVNLASSCVFLGELDQAQRILERLLGQHPDIAQAHWLLASARKATDRTHVEVLVNQVARGHRTGHDFAFLYYALGKELEDLQEWDRAFAAFSRGAKARRATLTYDEETEAAAYAAAARLFTREWLAAQAAGAEDASPIFVVGLPRTGTTLVERIITSHSQVRSAGELQQFGLSIRRQLDEAVPGRFSAALLERAATVDVRAVGDSY
ncbi:MAG TPA: tetratricopeptide repeat protein, partial [Pseudomonadales bacterium]